MLFKKAILGLAIAIICIGLLELLARFAESRIGENQPTDSPGWQTEFFADLIDWQERDPDLLWRFKADLNTPFIQTDSDHLLTSSYSSAGQRTARILLLGDSSPVGMGLKDRRLAFGDRLVRTLNGRSVDNSFELINAAVPGYSSEQVKRWLMKNGADYKPDLAIVYVGNNDASISGPFSDRALMESQAMGTLRRVLYHMALYRILCSAIHGDKSTDPLIDNRSVVRVAPDEYAENLRAIASYCRKNKIALVIIKPPVPLNWPAGLQFKPFNNFTDEQGRLIMPEPIRRILGQPFKYCLIGRFHTDDQFVNQVFASAYDDSLSSSIAVKEYQSALDTDRSDPILWNNMAVALWDLDLYSLATTAMDSARMRLTTDDTPLSQSVEAMYLYNNGIISMFSRDTALVQSQLDSALQRDFLSLRIKRSYLETIDSVAAVDYIDVLDLPTIFADHGGDSLFVDHCHPTAAGHDLIARSLMALLLEKGLIDR